MRKKWKNNLIYILTLALPTSLVIILPALFFNITPDITIKGADANTISYLKDDDIIYLYDFNEEVEINGRVIYRDDINKIVIPITEDDIIKFDNGYYKMDLSIYDETTRVFVDYEKAAIKKEQSYKFPITFFIAVGTVAIIGLVVSKKMTWHLKHPRIAVLVSLTVGTGVLAVINSLVGTMLNVFMAFTISWAAYVVEYHHLNKEEQDKQDKDEVDERIRRIKELSERL